MKIEYMFHKNINEYVVKLITVVIYRSGGEMAEMNFCDQKSLSMPTLRMTSEAKVFSN